MTMNTKQDWAIKLDELKRLLVSGEFHHATYRNQGTLWEGLHIYIHSSEVGSFRGFKSVGFFPKNDPDLAIAEELVRHTGISVGSYGKG